MGPGAKSDQKGGRVMAESGWIVRGPERLGYAAIGKPVEVMVQPKNGHSLAFGDFEHGAVCYGGILEEFFYGRHSREDEAAFVFRMKGWDQRTRVYLSDSQVMIKIGGQS